MKRNHNYKDDGYQSAVDEYNRTGVNHSNYDLNDYDEINEKLGYKFF
jgi:hypothetical protein